ncbi:MAG TPA: HAD-IB family hydrolase [Treponemataceae bacterium]|nr:HAD-IB family hydrolase [Treponemataceae bacterium]
MHRETIAFFDVDQTICRRNATLAFIVVCIIRGYIRFWYLLAAPFLLIAYRFFSLEVENLFKLSLPKLTGITRKQFEEVGRTAYSAYLKKHMHPGALREIAELRKNGVRVILATSSPFEAVYPVAQECGVSSADLISTQFSYTNGVFDGKLVGVPVYSKFKSEIITSFARMGGTDLHYCSFYSDSVHDLPLLEKVGRPVAANPDSRLKKIARRRGWAIKDFSK